MKEKTTQKKNAPKSLPFCSPFLEALRSPNWHWLGRWDQHLCGGALLSWGLFYDPVGLRLWVLRLVWPWKDLPYSLMVEYCIGTTIYIMYIYIYVIYNYIYSFHLYILSSLILSKTLEMILWLPKPTTRFVPSSRHLKTKRGLRRSAVRVPWGNPRPANHHPSAKRSSIFMCQGYTCHMKTEAKARHGRLLFHFQDFHTRGILKPTLRMLRV